MLVSVAVLVEMLVSLCRFDSGGRRRPVWAEECDEMEKRYDWTDAESVDWDSCPIDRLDTRLAVPRWFSHPEYGTFGDEGTVPYPLAMRLAVLESVGQLLGAAAVSGLRCDTHDLGSWQSLAAGYFDIVDIESEPRSVDNDAAFSDAVMAEVRRQHAVLGELLDLCDESR